MCRVEQLAISVALLTGVVLLVLFYISWKKYKEAKLKLERYAINTKSTIDMTIPAILDLIIEDSFDDYKIMILIPKGELYITDEREKEIRSDLICKVTERLSGDALDKISQFYNIKNIDKIIADKIYISVMSYVIAHNREITFDQSNNAKNKE